MRLKYRPLAVLGFTCLLVLFLSVYLNKYVSVVAISIGAVLLVLSFIFKRVRERIVPIFLACSLIMSGLMFIGIEKYDYKRAERFIGKQALITGTITDSPQHDHSRYYYILQVSDIDGVSVKTKLRLSLPSELEAEPYDTVKLKAKVYNIGEASNSVKLYYKSKGVFIGAYAYNNDEYKYEVQKCIGKPLGLRLLNVRNEITTRILDKLPNEYGGTVIAMLIGDKSFISDENADSFHESGITALFAVSGLHLSIWVMGLFGLLEQLKVKKRINSIIGISFALVFMAVTGFSTSVCRAGLMLILLLVGNLFFRRADSVNSLGFAALVLCLINPYVAVDVGFLLSFCSTLGIVTVFPLLNRLVLMKIDNSIIGRLLKSFLTIIFVGVCAIVGSFAITVIFIKYISLFSILTNLLVTYAATPCMLFGGLSALFFKVGFISDFFALISGLLARYILFVSNKISSLPVTTISTADIFWQIGVILCVLVLIFALILFKGKTMVKVLCAGLSVVIIACSSASYAYYDNLIQLRILNIDDGIAFIASGNKEKLVIESSADYYYSSGIVTDNLEEISRKRSNYLIVPMSEDVENSQTLSMIQDNSFGKIIVPVRSQSLDSIITDEKVIVSTSIHIDVFSDSSYIEYYCCDDYSLAYCSFDSVTALIIFEAEKNSDLPEKCIKADYLICDGYIPYSVDVKNFNRVIISSGENTGKKIEKYVNGNGVKTISTYDNGDIKINIKNGNSKIFVKEG